jgi:hypothetical protein
MGSSNGGISTPIQEHLAFFDMGERVDQMERIHRQKRMS